jgi:hypothetical protein
MPKPLLHGRNPSRRAVVSCRFVASQGFTPWNARLSVDKPPGQHIFTP